MDFCQKCIVFQFSKNKFKILNCVVCWVLDITCCLLQTELHDAECRRVPNDPVNRQVRLFPFYVFPLYCLSLIFALLAQIMKVKLKKAACTNYESESEKSCLHKLWKVKVKKLLAQTMSATCPLLVLPGRFGCFLIKLKSIGRLPCQHCDEASSNVQLLWGNSPLN